MSSTATASLIYINEGKFGSVRYLSGTSYAFKTVHTDTPMHQAELLKEFWIGVDIHDQLKSANINFTSPAYHLYGNADSMKDANADTVTLNDVPAHVEALCRAQPKTTFTFDLIPFLSQEMATAYGTLEGSPTSSDVRLLRLYLGRVPGASFAAVQKSSDTDPPLDLNQYQQLRDKLSGSVSMPSIEALCENMGEMLGLLHWAAGVNGRDSEICLGGDGSGGVGLVIFDYNMCERWLVRHPLKAIDNGVSELTTGQYQHNDLCSGAARLARLIANCETYYPRPRQGEVYQSFKIGYIRAVEDLLRRNTPGPEVSDSVKTRYADIVVGYQEGVKSFFSTYEEVDKEKMERWARRANRSDI